MVCPFDVITFEVAHAGGRHRLVSTKCDNCLRRQRSSETPACVEACKAGALAFGEVNEILRSRMKRFAKKLSLAVQEQTAEIEPLPGNMQMLRDWQRSVYELKV
jgi:carbon-monoxide dehydrogenase iron sulfur subunit